MSLIKVGFTGTFHSGKSTCLYDVAEELKKQGHVVIVLDEIARSCPLPINQECYLQTQLHISLSQITKEIEKGFGIPYDINSVLLTDRTILDNYAFCLSFQMRKRKKFVGTNIIKEILNWWLHTYDMVAYLKPLPTPIEDDGTRSTDQVWQRQIDRIIHSTIQHYRLNNIIHTIHTTNRQERVEEAMLHLTPLLKDSSRKKTGYNTSKNLVQEQIPIQEALHA